MGRRTSRERLGDDEVGALPRRTGDRHSFVHERLLVLIARETAERGSVVFRKGDLAGRMGCCVRSLDRAVSRLRARGLVASAPRFSDKGAQLGNEYRATRRGLVAARKILERSS